MKKMLALVMALAMTFSMAAFGQAEEITPPKKPLRYSLGTSSSGGNFYLVGGGIATVLNNALPDFFVMTAEETGGSTANLTLIQNGEAEVGISMTSAIAEAVKGEADWTGGQMDKIRGMVALYPSYLTIYSLKSTGATKLTDLNGKIVGLGSKGAAMDSILREAFDKMGITPLLLVGVAVLFSLPPFAAITELEASNDLSFVGLTEEEQNFLCENYPFYSKATMPAGSYKAVTEDIPTVSEWNMLVTSSDVPEDYVYLMTKTLLESNDALVQIYKGLSYVTAENILNYNCPLHAGTVRYLKEIGIDVPASLIPPEYAE